MPRARAASTTSHTDADSAWKQVLEVLLPDFLALVHPALHAALDWSQPVTLRDKELQAITRHGRKGRRAVDVLASVPRRDGAEQWVLVHVDVQGRFQADFPRRMFTYHARLLDRYDRPVVSFAVLTDSQASWRSDTYEHDYWGCAVSFRYPVVKILDWRGREAELATLDNPFAQVLLAQLAALTSPGQVEPLAATWLAILRRLARAGYTYAQISAVLTFLDRAIALPAEVETRIAAELAELEGTAMPQLMSRWEARVLHRGEEQIILLLLEQQCGPLTEEATARVRDLTSEQLADLGRALLRFTGPADLTAWFVAHPASAR